MIYVGSEQRHFNQKKAVKISSGNEQRRLIQTKIAGIKKKLLFHFVNFILFSKNGSL